MGKDFRSIGILLLFSTDSSFLTTLSQIALQLVYLFSQNWLFPLVLILYSFVKNKHMKPKTSRIEPSRYAKRMRNDEGTIHTILDESLVCHVSYVLEGQPFIIPTAYCRVDNTIYLHGSVGSHFFMQMAKGIPVCIAVTLVDALVLARSVFHHSLNYRSVVAFGTTRLVDDPAERWMAAERFTEHIIPGRWNDARQPSESELKKTMFIAVELEEVSAKVRDMGVGDDPEDMEAPVWAGLLPLGLRVGVPQQDEVQSGVPVPVYISQYTR